MEEQKNVVQKETPEDDEDTINYLMDTKPPKMNYS